MNTLSAIIICYNEAAHIRACLESVRFADEIIVVDSGSNDETLAIVREFTDKIYETDWPGYGEQKNRALNLASCDWVVSIDADETITPKLQSEITQILVRNSPEFAAFALPRQSNYLGRRIRFGDWRYDRPIRLFKRTLGHFTHDTVHERLIIDGKIGFCTHFITHEAFSTVDQVLDKLNRYSTLGAQMKAAQGVRGSLCKAIIHGTWTFLRGYVLRLGFLDGKQGFLLALSNAQGCFYRYIKLSFMH